MYTVNTCVQSLEMSTADVHARARAKSKRSLRKHIFIQMKRLSPHRCAEAFANVAIQIIIHVPHEMCQHPHHCRMRAARESNAMEFSNKIKHVSTGHSRIMPHWFGHHFSRHRQKPTRANFSAYAPGNNNLPAASTTTKKPPVETAPRCCVCAFT